MVLKNVIRHTRSIKPFLLYHTLMASPKDSKT